jgi:hypothetical protein
VKMNAVKARATSLLDAISEAPAATVDKVDIVGTIPTMALLIRPFLHRGPCLLFEVTGPLIWLLFFLLQSFVQSHFHYRVIFLGYVKKDYVSANIKVTN